MADFGALDNTNVDSSRGGGTAYMSTGVLPEPGTLDSVSVWLEDLGSDDSYRLGIYVGGSADSIAGAALVWDSALQSAPLNGWNTHAAGGEPLPAGRVWIVVQTDASSPTRGVVSPDNGDLDLLIEFWNAANGYLTGGLPDPAPAEDGTSSASQSVKAFITYTPSGSGSEAKTSASVRSRAVGVKHARGVA